ISDQGGQPHARTFILPDQTTDLIEWARLHNAGRKNIYWLPNETTREGKPSKQEMTVARFAWADCDPDLNRFESYSTARTFLVEEHAQRIARIASFVIDSGNGLQAFFRLSHDVVLPDQIAAYEHANQTLGAALEGPGTFNCDRIMRVPGTLNWPTAAKL